MTNGQKPTYPKRPPFFAHKATRLMFKTCVANDIGPAAFILLVAVVHTEDAARYLRPVTFYDSQLQPILGLAYGPLRRARKKAVASGWLHYEAGTKGRAGVYWITVPDHLEGLDDSPTDEGAPQECLSKMEGNNGNGHDDSLSKMKEQAQGKRRECAENAQRKRHTSVPVPVPVPNPRSERRALKKTSRGAASKALADVTVETLHDTGALLKLLTFLANVKVYGLTGSEGERVEFIAAAERALEVTGRDGGNPVALFRWIIKNRNWKKTNGEQEDLARKRLIDHRRESNGHAPNLVAVLNGIGTGGES